MYTYNIPLCEHYFIGHVELKVAFGMVSTHRGYGWPKPNLLIPFA